MTAQRDPDLAPTPTDAALGAIVFASSMMVLIGAFQAIAGLVALIDVFVIWGLTRPGVLTR